MNRPPNKGRLLAEFVFIATALFFPMFRTCRLVAPEFTGWVAVGSASLVSITMAGLLLVWRFVRRIDRHACSSAAPRESRGGATGLAFIALILGLVVSAFVAHSTHRSTIESASARFDHLTERILAEARRRVATTSLVVEAVRGLFESSKSVERAEFRRFCQANHSLDKLLGVWGLGFIQRVRPENMESFVEAERRDEAPSFTVTGGHSNRESFVVKFIEPLDPNLALWGVDFGEDHTRRAAIEQAVLSGEATLSGRLPMERDGEKKSGFMYLLAIYRNGTHPRTPEERVEALAGLVFARVDAHNFFDGIAAAGDGDLDVEIFDGPSLSMDTLLSDFDGHLKDASSTRSRFELADRMFRRNEELTIGGGMWTFRISTLPSFEDQVDLTSPVLLGICGLTSSVLLAIVVWSLGTSRARALTLAVGMTADLKAAKDHAEAAWRENEALRLTIDELMVMSITDPAGRIIEANDTFCRISGYSREELIGREHRIVNSGHHPPDFWSGMWRTVSAGRAWRGEVCNRAKDGSLYWVDSIIAPVKNSAGRIEKYLSIRNIITDRKRAEEELRASEERMRLFIQDAPAAIAMLDQNMRYLAVSRRFLDDFRIHETDVLGRTHYEMVPDLPVEWRDSNRRALQGETVRSDEDRFPRADGAVQWLRREIKPWHRPGGDIGGVVLFIEDVSERKKVQDELRVAARTDKLTSLPNRSLFQERLQRAVRRADSDSDYHFAVLFLDFDRFKIINDSLGHDVGDQLLRQIANRLTSTIRPTDSLSRIARGNTAARLGGDEFVLLLDQMADPSDASLVADRLLNVLSAPYQLGGHEVYSTASIGIVTDQTRPESAEDVLRNADIAMYEAKLAGKGRYTVFDTSMHDRVRRRHELEIDLRQAVDAGQVFLVYQPIVSLHTGEAVNYEALVRWNHPTRGLVMPNEFIPIGEDTGIITVLGEWVLRTALRDFATWRTSMGSNAPLAISINLSRTQLMLSDLPDVIRRTLDEMGVDPSSLHLEVTESAIMRDVELSKRVLTSLSELGVVLAMDDFGTGYSSLASLHQFPVDVLKIDRSFIANLNLGRDFVALVHAVANLAHNLRIEIVAEGIETPEQIALLQSLDCQYGQGYFFSRPLGADEVPGFKVCQKLLLEMQAATAGA